MPSSSSNLFFNQNVFEFLLLFSNAIATCCFYCSSSPLRALFATVLEVCKSRSQLGEVGMWIETFLHHKVLESLRKTIESQCQEHRVRNRSPASLSLAINSCALMKYSCSAFSEYSCNLVIWDKKPQLLVVLHL